jgi:hypothetical protein
MQTNDQMKCPAGQSRCTTGRSIGLGSLFKRLIVAAYVNNFWSNLISKSDTVRVHAPDFFVQTLSFVVNKLERQGFLTTD